MSSKEIFWLDDPALFISDYEKVFKIIPEKHMSLTEQLNATLRFSIYFSVVIFIIKHDVRTFLFIIFIAFLTILIKNNTDNEKWNKKKLMENLELSENKNTGEFCNKSTKDNPFMNVMFDDYLKFPNRPPACNITKDSVKKKTEKNFASAIFNDVEDIYGRNTHNRQFFTMPVTTIPNDQKKFAESLYMRNPSTEATHKQRHNNYYKK